MAASLPLYRVPSVPHRDLAARPILNESCAASSYFTARTKCLHPIENEDPDVAEERRQVESSDSARSTDLVRTTHVSKNVPILLTVKSLQ